jgi:hypothetical protein
LCRARTNISSTLRSYLQSAEERRRDLRIDTAASSETRALRHFAGDSVHLVGNGAYIRNPTYGIIAHGILTSIIDMGRFEENKDIASRTTDPSSLRQISNI